MLRGPEPRDAKVLLADVCPLVRDGLKRFLQPFGVAEIVGEATTAGQTVELAAELLPAYVIIDPAFGSGDIEASVCQRLKSLPLPPRIIAHTAHDSPVDVATLVLAGADCFVHKSTDLNGLAEARRRILAGERVWMLGPGEGDADLHVRIAAKRMRLTPKEQRVFDLALKRYTNAEIARKLYLSPQTVKNHLGSVFRKLEIKDRKELYSLLET